MTPLRVLDLNDWELSLYRGPELEVQSPGFALVEAKKLIFGEPALAEHRRAPLSAHSSYWHRLDASPVRSRSRDVRTSADLVFNQLKLLIASGSAQGQEVVIAVPSHHSKDQLEVLLGIVEETPIAPLGFVDACIASGSTNPGDFVLDVSLHQMTITRLAHEEGMVTRLTVESVPDGGLLPILDTWLARIADEFVRETRFDPLRIADTEQQLWSHLYAWLGGEVSARDYGLYLEVGNKSGRWHVNFDVRELLRLTASQTKAAVALCAEVPNARLRVTSRAARIPGLVQGVHDAGIENYETLSPDAVIKGIAGNATMFAKRQETGISFVTSLKSLAADSQGAQSSAGGRESSVQARGGESTAQTGEGESSAQAGRAESPAQAGGREASISTRPPTSEPEPLKDAPTHLVYAGIAYEVGDSVDLRELIPGFPAKEAYRIKRTSRAIDIYRTGKGSEDLVQSLGCGDSLVAGDQELMAIRLAAHGA